MSLNHQLKVFQADEMITCKSRHYGHCFESIAGLKSIKGKGKRVIGDVTDLKSSINEMMDQAPYLCVPIIGLTLRH